MKYEELIIEFESEVIVDERDLTFDGFVYNCNIALNKNIDSHIKKTCILAEEIGHFKTNAGNVLNINRINNQKQERMARAWGYEKLLSIDTLISAFQVGCIDKHEIAEFADVTSDFVDDAVRYYKDKYGLYKDYEDYTVFFDPLGVMMKLI